MRALRADEQSLLRALIASSDRALLQQLPDALVQESEDGTVGIRFLRPFDGLTRFSRTVATADFIDGDGMPVSTALHVDKGGRLMELDFAKMDFSPILKYPSPNELVIRPATTFQNESRWEILRKLWRDDIPVDDLGNYVARRAAIIAYLGIAWLPFKFLLMILDLLTTGVRGGGVPDAGLELWRLAFCLMALAFIAIAPTSVWRSAVKGLAVDHTPAAARVDANWYAAATVLVLVVPAIVFVAICK